MTKFLKVFERDILVKDLIKEKSPNFQYLLPFTLKVKGTVMQII